VCKNQARVKRQFLRHPSFTIVTQKRKRRKFASPVRNYNSTPLWAFVACSRVSFTFFLLRKRIQLGLQKSVRKKSLTGTGAVEGPTAKRITEQQTVNM
jgi:hypothetical protein